MESVALVAPVTALEFAGGVLLAGEGPGMGTGDRDGDRDGERDGDGAGVVAVADALSGRHGPGGGGVPVDRRRRGDSGGAAERAA